MSSHCLREILTFDSYLIENSIRELKLSRSVDFDQINIEKAILNENKNIFMYFNDKNLEQLPGRLVSKYILMHIVSSNKENLFQSQVPYFDYLSRCEIYKFYKCECRCCPIFNNGLTFKVCGKLQKLKIPILKLTMDKKSILKLFSMLDLNLKEIWINHYYTNEAYKEMLMLSHNDINIFHIIFNTLKKPLTCIYRANVCRCGSCYISKHVYWNTVHGIPHVSEDDKGTFICSLTLSNCQIKHYHDIPWLMDFGNTYFIGRRLLDEINTKTPQYSMEIEKLLGLFNISMEDYQKLMCRKVIKGYFNSKYGMSNMMKFVRTYNLWAENNDLSKIRWNCFKNKSAINFAENAVKNLNQELNRNTDPDDNHSEVFEDWDSMVNTSINFFSEVLIDNEPLPIRIRDEVHMSVSENQVKFQENVDNLEDSLKCLIESESPNVEACQEIIKDIKEFAKSENILEMGKPLNEKTLRRVIQPPGNPGLARAAEREYDEEFEKTWPINREKSKLYEHKKGDTCMKKPKPLRMKGTCTYFTGKVNEVKKEVVNVLAELRGYKDDGGIKAPIDYYYVNKIKEEDFLVKVLGHKVIRTDREDLLNDLGDVVYKYELKDRYIEFVKNDEEVKIDKFSDVLISKSDNPIISKDSINFPLRRFKKFIRNKFLTDLRKRLHYTNYTIDDNFNFVKIKDEKNICEDRDHKQELVDMLHRVINLNTGYNMDLLKDEFLASNPNIEWKTTLKHLTRKIINTFKKRIMIHVRNRRNQSRLLTLKDDEILSLGLGMMTNEYSLIKQVKDTTLIRATEIHKLFSRSVIFDKIY